MNKEQFLHISITKGICMYKKGKTPLKLHCGNYNTLVDNEQRIPILYPLSDYEKFDDILGLIYCNEIFRVIKGWQKIEDLSFLLVNKMIELHIDVFNLIEKGEAIDVNTLEINPYK